MLGVTVDASALNFALSHLSAPLARSNDGLLIVADDDEVSLRAYSHGIDVRVTLADPVVRSSGKIQVPPVFARLVKTMHGPLNLDETTMSANVECGSLAAELRMFSPDKWTPFKFCDGEMAPAVGFTQAVKQISPFAASPPRPPIDGLHLTNGLAVGTDNYALASYPLDIPIDEPTTIPLGVLGRVLGTSSEPLFAVENRKFYIKDGPVEIVSAIYVDAYPNLARIEGMIENTEHTISFRGDVALGSLRQMAILTKGERVGRIRLDLDDGEARVSTEVPDLGSVSDRFDFDGEVTHSATFDPKYLDAALSGCGEQPEVSFSVPLNNKHTPWIFKNPDTGFLAAVMPLVVI